VALFDLMGRVLLESSWMVSARKFAADLRAPWIFASDEPEARWRTTSAKSGRSLDDGRSRSLHAA
jgi:hypothetical protein